MLLNFYWCGELIVTLMASEIKSIAAEFDRTFIVTDYNGGEYLCDICYNSAEEDEEEIEDV